MKESTASGDRVCAKASLGQGGQLGPKFGWGRIWQSSPGRAEPWEEAGARTRPPVRATVWWGLSLCHLPLCLACETSTRAFEMRRQACHIPCVGRTNKIAGIRGPGPIRSILYPNCYFRNQKLEPAQIKTSKLASWSFCRQPGRLCQSP